jgi:hypothetical protein
LGMGWLQSTYTIRLNHRHQLTRHVLSGRYNWWRAAPTATCGAFAITSISIPCGPSCWHWRIGSWTIPGAALRCTCRGVNIDPAHFFRGRLRKVQAWSIRGR